MTFSLAVLIIFVLLIAGAIAAVVYTIRKQRKQEAQSQLRLQNFNERQERAVWGAATIINARGGIITGSEAGISQWARYELSLEATPPDGSSYIAHTFWLVETAQMSILQQGMQMSIKIDQQDPTLIYPNVSWAKFISPG